MLRDLLIVLSCLFGGCAAAATTLDRDDGALAMSVLALEEDGLTTHVNFGPYDLEVLDRGYQSFRFDLEVAERPVWAVDCATGDEERLLCSFLERDGERRGLLTLEGRGGRLRGAGQDFDVRAAVGAGWTLSDEGPPEAGVQLLGRDRVWLAQDADQDARALMAAVTGALWLFEDGR